MPVDLSDWEPVAAPSKSKADFSDWEPVPDTAGPFEPSGVIDKTKQTLPSLEIPEWQTREMTLHPTVMPDVKPALNLYQQLTKPLAETRQQVFEPLREMEGIKPQPEWMQVPEPPRQPSTGLEKGEDILEGVLKTGSSFADFFTSPLGVGTLGIGSLPAALQKVVALGFATTMAKEVPHIATELGTELGKPKEEQDLARISELVSQAVANTGFAALGAAHGAGRPLAEKLGAYPATDISEPAATQPPDFNQGEPNANPQPSPVEIPRNPPPEPAAQVAAREPGAVQQPAEAPPKGEDQGETQSQAPEEVASPIADNLYVTDDLSLRNAPVKLSDVIGVKKTTNDSVQTVYAIRYRFLERDGKLSEGLAYSDDPVWELHEKFGKGFGETKSTEKAAAQPSPPVEASPAAATPAQEQGPGIVGNPDITTGALGKKGMGAANYSEVEGQGDPDIYGVAERVREQRAKAGQTIPIDPGKGVSALEAVVHGQDLLAKDPNSARVAVDEFSKNKAISFDGMAATRAMGEKAFRDARRIEEKFGTDSPEYKAAFLDAVQWDKASKEMQTEWHKQGRAQQGQTDIDTGSFTGLQRAFKSDTEKDFTPNQAGTAKKKASKVKQASDAATEAKGKLLDHLDKESKGTDAEKRALDAANKTVRENAIRIAELENKVRIARTVREGEIARIQLERENVNQRAAQQGARSAAVKLAEAENKKRIAESSRKALDDQVKATQKALDSARKVATDAATKLADAETKQRVSKSSSDRKAANAERLKIQKVLDAANKQVRDAAVALAKAERDARANPEQAVWKKVREYLDKGEDDFDEIRNKVATDLGMKVEKVTRLLNETKRAKFLADDVWRKQQTERRMKEDAKRWLTSIETPFYHKALANIPKILFGLKVGFHGTVALGTHAPMVAFQPRFWNSYIRDFGKMYRMVNPKGGKAYYEMQVQDLLRRKNYVTARRAGLVNDPFVFEDYNSPDTAKYFGGLTGMGNRGYSVLKILRQDMFDQHWNKLPKTSQIPEVAAAIADGINHATGVVKGKAPSGANIALFAPRLEASRAMWLLGDPIRAADTFINWKDSSLGEKQFAINQVKEKAWVAGTFFGLLALNQGFLSATGSNQKVNMTDPMKSDFMKFKVAGMQVSYGNAMLSMARLPLRLWVGIKNEGKLNKIIYEDENTAKTLFDYARSQSSPFMGLILDLAFGRDFQGRPLPRAGFGLLPARTAMPKRLRALGAKPYTWPEYAAETLSMIPVSEALKEVWGKGMGMSDEQMRHALKALAEISFIGGTGGRLTDDIQPKP